MKRLSLVASFLLAGLAQAQTGPLSITRAGPDASSAYASLIWVHFANDAYTAVDWQNDLSHAQLYVDGRPSPWTSQRLIQPPGIGPRESWEGCLPLSDFGVASSAGKHRIYLVVGPWKSNEIVMELPAARAQALSEGEIVQETRRLISVIPDGIPRTCVEQWFTEHDGGLLEPGAIRYYVKPRIKVVVRYKSTGGSGADYEKVHGRIRMFREEFVAD